MFYYEHYFLLKYKVLIGWITKSHILWCSFSFYLPLFLKGRKWKGNNIVVHKISDGDPFISRKRILIHISWGLDYILFFIKHFLSVLKISNTFVFFLRMSSEYLTRYGQGSVFKIRFQGSVVKTDPCLYFFEYSREVLRKKTKVRYF